MWKRKKKRQAAVTVKLWAKVNQRLIVTGHKLNHYLQTKSGRLTRKQLTILLVVFCLVVAAWNTALIAWAFPARQLYRVSPIIRIITPTQRARDSTVQSQHAPP